MNLDQYKKEKLENHIYNHPDTYVGGCDPIEENLPVWNEEKKLIEFKQDEWIPAVFKIYDEILVNARDQIIRINSRNIKTDIPVTTLKITINKEKGEVSIYNDGTGVDVALHPTEVDKDGNKIWIPALIFGELLTSINYDKNEKKIVGGKNGYGAKLTNIFSTHFELKTVDHTRNKKYIQCYSNNMKEKGKPMIITCKSKPFTKITWKTDFERFGIKGFSDFMVNLMIRRVYDISGVTDKNISVYLNDKKIKVNNFMDYSKMYLSDNDDLVYEELSDRWKIGVSVSKTDKFEQISFVNGVATFKGGKHVDYICKLLLTGIKEYIQKKHKKTIQENYIRNYLRVFINSVIENPSFDSQTKERLISPPGKFGSKPIIDDKFIKRIVEKTDIVDKVIQFSEFKLNKENKKTDGSKKNKIRDIPKLDDANWAGTKKSKECILILTEGDSAKSMAISGLSVVGRDRYGVFPLKGKVMNVKDASKSQIMNNAEITNMKKILGLETGKEYKDTNSLRYGKIMIMTDQDHDGSHIKGLVMNVFHTMWPSLLQMGFLTSMITPIVKVSKGKNILSFYNLTDYNDWQKKKKKNEKWTIKYYKGLGTSNAAEAREYFQNIKMNNYIFTEETNDSMNLAFNKNLSNMRKDWLYNYNVKNILNHTDTEIPIQDFINKELIHFSNSDTLRSIGSLYDGLKPSQRKIMYSCFKRKLYSEIRVAQLAGYVSENAAYHHGEMSLQSAIIGMAQNYTGSNNINLLMPNGQFGTRIMGGHDSASSRYIHTELNKLIDLIYPAVDFPIINYEYDDGVRVEPKYYVPIIPMVLVNGMNGIGTGFSTSIPKYNPTDVINNIKKKLKNEEYEEIKPWYSGFKGDIIKIDDKNYLSKGKYEIINATTIKITELPIGKWTDDYKKFLDTLLPEEKRKKSKEKETTKAKKCIIDYTNNSSDTEIEFVITVPLGFIKGLQWCDDEHVDGIEKYFKLHNTKGLSLNNVHLYDKEKIIKLNSIYEIFDRFYDERYQLYIKRKESLLENLLNELQILSSKKEFISKVMNEEIIIYKRKKIEIIQDLIQSEFHQVVNGKIIEEKNKSKDVKTNNYDYLIKMSLYSFTEDEIDRLNKEYDKSKLEYDTLKNKTIETIWLEELHSLSKQYFKYKLKK
jgi:DNA topoisomerase-2